MCAICKLHETVQQEAKVVAFWYRAKLVSSLNSWCRRFNKLVIVSSKVQFHTAALQARKAANKQIYAYQNKVTSQKTMSGVQSVTGILPAEHFVNNIFCL